LSQPNAEVRVLAGEARVLRGNAVTGRAVAAGAGGHVGRP
jgi:hypothetical protein